ncbi:MAG: hypothetical protein ACSLEX_03495 [Minisyncoccota bacterium]
MFTLIAVVLAGVLYFFDQNTGALLVVVGVVAKNLAPFICLLVSAPGFFVIFPDDSNKRSMARFIVGIIIATFLQAILWFFYVVFVINLVLSVGTDGNVAFLIWGLTFFTISIPFYFTTREIREHAETTGRAADNMEDATFMKSYTTDDMKKIETNLWFVRISFLLAIILAGFYYL